jgi:predicted SAM-dependent methyltransferase
MEFIYNTNEANSPMQQFGQRVIDIGSGPHPKPDADTRMDIHQWGNVNLIHNLTVTPYPIATGLYDKAYMGDVLEHISIFDVDAVLQEVNRILKSGATLEVTVPDARWIFERIIKNDWNHNANVDWLNPTMDPWKNAMSYLFGGFHNKDEYKLEGMGHVNAFDQKSLKALLERNGFVDCERHPDMRNPEPARMAVLRMVCKKV